MKGDEKFIQLGLRRKGRIVKNEQYNIEEFFGSMPYDPWKSDGNFDNIPFFKRFSFGHLHNKLSQAHSDGYRKACKDMAEHTKKLIDQDEFGKKKKDDK